MTGREKFSRFSFVINLLSSFFRIFGTKINLLLLSFFRNTNGTKGLVLRYIFLKNTAKKVGVNVSIQPGVFIYNPQNIVIGDNVSIHPMCYLEGVGGIEIGNNVSIAHASTLISTNHAWEDESLPIKYNEQTFEAITIAEDVWVGCGVRILAGVHINKRSVIAAGAVVNRSFGEKSLIGGVPARLLKRINQGNETV